MRAAAALLLCLSAEGLPPDDPLAAFNADATAYGLTVCGSAGAPAAGRGHRRVAGPRADALTR